MESGTVKVILLTDGQGTGGQKQRDTLAAFFGACGVEAEVAVYDGQIARYDLDAAIVMGDIGAGTLDGAALAALRKNEIPAVFFGVYLGPEGVLPSGEWMEYPNLVSAQATEFMRSADTYVEVLGDPCDSLEALAGPGGGRFKKESPLLEKQMVFVANILEMIRQKREMDRLGRLSPQDALDRAENERAKKNFHLSRWLYETAYAATRNPLVLFRKGENEDLLGHPEAARRMMLKAVQKDPKQVGEVLKQKYRYNPALFKNKYVENCPLCGRKGVIYSAVWCPYATTYDERFDPIKVWWYCPDCHHGFGHNIPANLEALAEDNYSFMTHYLPGTDYGTVVSFSAVLGKLARWTDGRKLLDVGAGQGELALAALQHGYDYTGIEIVPAYANNVQRFIHNRVYCADVMDVELEEPVDIIIAGDVIEHVENPRALVKKLAGMVKEAGFMWMSTPDLFAPYHAIKPDGDGMPMEVWHLNYFTYRSLRGLLADEGFEVVEMCISPRYLGSIEVICKRMPAG